MADLLGIVRRALWFCVGFALVAVFALHVENAHAQYPCYGGSSDRNTYTNQCEALRASCAGNNSGYICEGGGCTSSGQTYPACLRFNESDLSLSYSFGFTGLCPSSGSDGPTTEFTGGVGESPPDIQCSGPCKIDTQGCSTVSLPDGTVNHVCVTQYTGDRCVSGPSQPDSEQPERGNCESGAEINGDCIEMNDADSDPLQSPSSPEVCMGPTCAPVPPNPDHTGPECRTGANGAVCVGEENNPGSAPAPPSPPYPPAQQPEHSGTATSPGGGQTPVTFYGPPWDNNAGPPDENGNCPTGSVPSGSTCVCTGTLVFNGSACVAGDNTGCGPDHPQYPNCEGDEDDDRTAGTGTCGSTPPACSGDEIDCSILFQTFQTRCALLGTDDPPGIDLSDDPLQQYGGADGLFEDEDIGPGDLDESGFLGGGGCPTMQSINVLGKTIEFTPVWCELSWLGGLLVALAYFMAARIVYGD